MDNNETQPQSFVEMVLALLEHRFPWLGQLIEKPELPNAVPARNPVIRPSCA